jgi:hypothetical protein
VRNARLPVFDRDSSAAAPVSATATYGRFTLHTAGPDRWRGIARDVTRRTGLTIEVSPPQDRAATAAADRPAG